MCESGRLAGTVAVGMGPDQRPLVSGLFRFERVWAAAGSPFSVFAIEPASLRDAAGATVADLGMT